MTHLVPDEIRDLIKASFGEIINFRPVSGGSINSAGMIETPRGRVFIKWNDSQRFPGMFQAEKQGLDLLFSSDSVMVPSNILVFEGNTYSGLMCDYIETVRGDNALWESAGASLARMHLNFAPRFGLEYNNYMGSLHQSNTPHDTFPGFFLEERLLPQVRLAVDARLINHQQAKNFEQLRLERFFQDEPACIVHGDLWSGNIIFDLNHPYLIDPAVAWSSRHVDLAMSTMFGRFPESFYHAYTSVYPYTQEEASHWDLVNLYPLLIHVNLFGSSYLHETLHILKKYA